MSFVKLFIFLFSSIFFLGCSSSQSQNSDSRFHFFSNTTGVSYAGNRMRVKKLSPTQYRIKAYNDARKNK